MVNSNLFFVRNFLGFNYEYEIDVKVVSLKNEEDRNLIASVIDQMCKLIKKDSEEEINFVLNGEEEHWGLCCHQYRKSTIFIFHNNIFSIQHAYETLIHELLHARISEIRLNLTLFEGPFEYYHTEAQYTSEELFVLKLGEFLAEKLKRKR